MNKNKLSKKAKIIISSVTAFLLVIGILAYAAADRYLIQHVEVDLENTSLAVTSASSAMSSNKQVCL